MSWERAQMRVQVFQTMEEEMDGSVTEKPLSFSPLSFYQALHLLAHFKFARHDV